MNLDYEQMALYTLILPGPCIVSILVTVATLWWAYRLMIGWLEKRLTGTNRMGHPINLVITLFLCWGQFLMSIQKFSWLSSLRSFQIPLSDQFTIDFPAMLFPNLHHPAKWLVGAHGLVIVALKHKTLPLDLKFEFELQIDYTHFIPIPSNALTHCPSFCMKRRLLLRWAYGDFVLFLKIFWVHWDL